MDPSFAFSDIWMRAVVQRVHEASVTADGHLAGKINKGLLIFLGIEKSDTIEDLAWLAAKLPKLRCFEDDKGRMNANLHEAGGEAMVISQFTLYGSLKKGSRPSFNRAADPQLAVPLYEKFVERLSEHLDKPVATGVFGAHMDIVARNDGPVTLIIDTRNKGL